jgi:hypothetical protein
MPSFIEARAGAKEGFAAFGFAAKDFEGTLAHWADGPDGAFTLLSHERTGVWIVPWGLLIDGGTSVEGAEIISACI